MEDKTITVTEPAKGSYVATAESNQSLYFPEVDTCLAIVFRLDDGRAIGGHVPMIWGGEDQEINPMGNAKNILKQMFTHCERNIIDQVVVVGAQGTWRDDNKVVKLIQNEHLLKDAKFNFKGTESDGTVDVYASSEGVEVKKGEQLVAKYEFPEVNRYSCK